MDWSDVLKAALSLFLVLTGIALAYLFLRMAGVFGRLGVSVTRVTDEIVPILARAQTTMDGVNREIDRVDEIMVSAVHGAKGAEKAVTSVSTAVTAPVKKLSGFGAGVREAYDTFRARRRADALDRATAPPIPPAPPVAPPPMAPPPVAPRPVAPRPVAHAEPPPTIPPAPAADVPPPTIPPTPGPLT